MGISKWVVFLALICVFDSAICHNYFSNPVSRGNQQQTQTGCRYGGEGNPTCGGPCDRTVGNSVVGPISVQRGQTIQPSWYRHTHPGGFVRFAWSPTASSDAHASFDAHVDRYVCKEVGGCGPSDPAAADSSTNGIDCTTTLTVPTWLTDGTWTLQWAYYGGWLNAGDYYACVDYTVSGGPTGPQTSPVFIGGDYTYPTESVCLFYSTNALHVCTEEPCMNGSYTLGQPQKGAAAIYLAGTYTPVDIAGTPGSGGVISSSSSEGDQPVPCTANSGCSSGVCGIDGFCTKTKASNFGAGGVAAIVFAMLVLVLVGIAVVFFVLNKKEIAYMKPFKGHV